jgi:hypothetical protein
MMLYVEMHFLHPNGIDWQEHLKTLKPLVADSPELIALIENRLRPREENPELLAMEAEMKERQTKHDQEEAEAHESWVRFWHEVAENPDLVFSQGRSENTAWNLWRAMARSGEESRASGWNRRFIERQFGKTTADQLRTALISLWRKDRPTLRSERPEGQKDTYQTRWQLGLAAIAAEAEDAGWARNLTPEQAALAARYAPIELNGFPSWLESLVCAHPQAVDATLGQELTANLNEPLSTNPRRMRQPVRRRDQFVERGALWQHHQVDDDRLLRTGPELAGWRLVATDGFPPCRGLRACRWRSDRALCAG